MNDLWLYFIALAPTVGVAFLFYLVIKNVLEADRKERIAHAQWEAEQEKIGNGSEMSAESAAPGAGPQVPDDAGR